MACQDCKIRGTKNPQAALSAEERTKKRRKMVGDGRPNPCKYIRRLDGPPPEKRTDEEWHLYSEREFPGGPRAEKDKGHVRNPNTPFNTKLGFKMVFVV